MTGAAILVVVVVLVVPSLLTGRRPTVPEQDPSGSSKTYEIDLAGDGGSAAEGLRHPVPEPVATPPATPRSIPTPTPQPAAPRSEPADTASSVRSAPTGVPSVTLTPRVHPEPLAAAPGRAAADPVPPVGQQAVAALVPAAWAVQLGAFAGRDAASKLVADLRAKGYAAFMLELRRDGKVLYRVRVGPEPDRARAAAIAERLNREGYKASVAAHP